MQRMACETYVAMADEDYKMPYGVILNKNNVVRRIGVPQERIGASVLWSETVKGIHSIACHVLYARASTRSISLRYLPRHVLCYGMQYSMHCML